MLSRWSSVRVSELPELELLDWLPPHPAHARVKSSGRTCHVARRIIVAPVVEGRIGCAPSVLNLATIHVAVVRAAQHEAVRDKVDEQRQGAEHDLLWGREADRI